MNYSARGTRFENTFICWWKRWGNAVRVGGAGDGGIDIRGVITTSNINNPTVNILAQVRIYLS